jgi:cystathionine gamma-synthase
MSNTEAGPTGVGPPTRAVRAGIGTDREHGAVVPPIHLTSTFAFEGYGRPRTYDYTRSGNPTRALAADAIASLEEGAGAIVTSSGMSAVTLALQLLRPGELLVAPCDCYGGTYRAMKALSAQGHFDLEFVDPEDHRAIEKAAARRPRMLWVETPSNPLLRITDIRRMCELGRDAGALVVVDNTFLSPVFQTPILLGADAVVHSTTKYLNGHSDVVGGAVVAAEPELHEELDWWANCLGLSGAPFDAFLTLRGIRTLFARMAVHETNASAVVACLTQHPSVLRVYHPSLPEHPGHELAKQQQRGFGAMISFELDGGEPAVRTFLESVQHFCLAESLGGVESLVAHPASMTHASMDPEARRRAGILDSLIRLSIGIEAAEDLVHDVERALERAAAVAREPATTARTEEPL